MTAHERLRLASLRRRADAVMLHEGMRDHFEKLAARLDAPGPDPFGDTASARMAWLAAIVEAAEEAAHSAGGSGA